MASPAVTYRDGQVDLHLNPEEDGSLDAESDSSHLIGTRNEGRRSNIRSVRFWRKNCYSIFGLSVITIACAAAIIVRLAMKVSPSNAPEVGPVPEAITMGVNAKEGEFPYQALVHNYFTLQNCGGSIYNKRFIITAAHCVTNIENGTVNDAASTIVRVGFTNIDDPNAIERSAYKIHVHHLYGDPNYPFIADIALIELKEDIIFNEKIQPIRIAKRANDTMEGTPVTITGWGDTTFYNDSRLRSMTMDLQVGKSVIVNFDNCSIAWVRAMNLTTVRRTMFCMSPEQSSCYGDSGSPVVNKYKVQIGIVYYSWDCGVNTTIPSVATEIFPWRSWIKRTANLSVAMNRELDFLNKNLMNLPQFDIKMEEMLHIDHGNESNIFNHTQQTIYMINRNATTGSVTAILNSTDQLDDVLNRRGPPKVSIPRSYITPHNPGPFPAIDKKVFLKSVNMTAPVRRFLNPQPKPSQSRQNRNRGRLIMRLL